MAESNFQKKVAQWLRDQGCYVITTTVIPGVPTGCPDVIGLAKTGRWVTLECKQSATSSFRPLQRETIAKLDRTGYSRAVYPENWAIIQCELLKII